MEGNELPLGITIPSTASGIVKSDASSLETPIVDGGRDLTPEEMLKTAEDMLNSQKGDKTDDNIDAPTAEEIQSLTKKAQETPDKLTDEEIKKLVKAGIIEGDSDNTDDTNIDPEVKAKLNELQKKKPEELTDEEKKFIEDNTSEPELIISLKDTLKEELGGIEIKGDYSNDTEGVKKLINDVAKIKTELIIQELRGSDKKLDALYQHFVEEGRGIETFITRNTEPVFKSIKLEEVSDVNTKEENDAIVNNQKALLAALYQSKGIDKEEYEVLIDGYEKTGKLFDKAKDAKKNLETAHKEKLTKTLQEEEQRIQEYEKEVEKSWNIVKDTLKKNNINGFSIPAADLAAFSNAVLNPINEKGLTKMDVIRQQKDSIERRLLIDYLYFKDFDVKSLTPAALATSKRVLKFKQGKEADKDRTIPFKGMGTSTPTSTTKRPNINFRQVQIQ